MTTRPVTTWDVLDGHVTLDLQCLDRLYLNGPLRASAGCRMIEGSGPVPVALLDRAAGCGDTGTVRVPGIQGWECTCSRGRQCPVGATWSPG